MVGVLLGVCCLVTGAAVWFFRRAYRRCAGVPVGVRPRGEELGLYEVAFLSGRGKDVAVTAMASMLLGGRLSVRDKVVTVVDPVPRDAVEAAVVDVVGLRPRRGMWRRMDRLARRPAIDAVGDRLAGQGLIASSPSRYRVFDLAEFLLWVSHWVSAVLGVVAVGVAVARDGPVPAVSAVVVAVMVVGGLAHRHAYVPLPGVTAAGRAALAGHRARFPAGVWVPASNDALSRERAVLLGEAVRGWSKGELVPLREATTWPSSGSVPPGFDDPPGLGGL